MPSKTMSVNGSGSERWDLVIIDEAHKCSAYTKSSSARGDEVAKTKRYQTCRAVGRQRDHLLLLTATPHHGDDDRFAHFIRLIDPDLFPEPHRVGTQGHARSAATFSGSDPIAPGRFAG